MIKISSTPFITLFTTTDLCMFVIFEFISFSQSLKLIISLKLFGENGR